MAVPKKIDELFAFIAQEGDDDEGILGVKFQGQWVPLVGADMERVKSLKGEFADLIASATGKKYKIYKFSQRTDITDEIK